MEGYMQGFAKFHTLTERKINETDRTPDNRLN